MFKSFISKFIFFFWSFFIIVTMPTYFFTTYQFKNIIKNSEQERITVALDTIKPIISIHIFLNQDKQLNELLNNMFKHEDIKSVKLVSTEDDELYYKKRDGFKNKENVKSHQSYILDPVSQVKIATLYLKYTNHHLTEYNEQILIVLISTILFSIFIFSIGFLYIRGDFVALKGIAESLKQYSLNKNTKPIIQSSRSKEISTIANVANQMFVNIEGYVKELKSFNHKLEKRVKYEIDKQQNQQRLMIHQSRQAAMGEMLESIAHQWRQPLNIIGLAAANLETEYELGLIDKKKFHDKMEIISLNINYMSSTIDDFRNFLNPQKNLINFEAKQSINDVLKILKAQFSNLNISYMVEQNCDTIFHGVENEFKQVMIILLNNAKDAIKIEQEKDQHKQGNIRIVLDCLDSYGVINIYDNGCGIDDAIKESIFDPYFTTKSNANGTGIGLYIAKNIIESKMKGNITVKNTADGCCFNIYIPLAKES